MATAKSDIVTDFGLELGIFVICALYVVTLVLDKIKGQFSRLESFFALKSWDFIQRTSLVGFYTKLFRFMVIFIISWPVLGLIAWGVCVLKVTHSHNTDSLPGIAIFLAGGFFIFFILGTLSIKNNNLKLSFQSFIYFIIGFGCFFAFQLVSLLKPDTKSYFGVSAVFLSLNGFIMVIITFLHYGNNSLTILEVIKTSIKPGESRSIIDPKLDLKQINDKERLDPNYEPTQGEIFKLFTVCQSPEEFKSTALAGGIQRVYKSKSNCGKFVYLLVLYLVALGILAIYAWITSQYTDNEYHGPIIAIAVVTTDIILLQLMRCKLANGPIEISLILFTFRAFLFGFGGKYWFIGYVALYLCVGVFLDYHIVNYHYPTHEEGTIRKRRAIDITQTPHFSWFSATIIISAIMIYLGEKKTGGIPANGFKLYGDWYAFWKFGVAGIIFNIIVLMIFLTLRLFYRRTSGIKDFSIYYAFSQKLNSYYIFLLCTYALIVSIGLLWWSLTDQFFILFSCIFLPLIYECMLIIYYNWKLNDYSIIANVKRYNEKMRKYKEIRQKQIEQRLALKKELEQQDGQKKQEELEQQKKIDNDIEELLKNLDSIEQRQIKKKNIKEALQKSEFDEDNNPNLYLVVGNADPMNLRQSFKEEEDWRLKKISFLKALFTKQLLNSDYKIIFSFLIMAAFMISYSFAVGYTSDQFPLLGVTLSICILSFTMMYLPLKLYFATLQNPTCQQFAIFIIGFIINCAWGVIYTQIRLNNDDEPSSIKENGCAWYIFYVFFVVPWIVTFTTFFLRWKDNKFKLNKIIWFILIFSGIFAIGMGVYIIIVRNVFVGVGVIVFWFYAYYALFVFKIYKRNNKSLPKILLYISILLVIVVCLIALIAAVCLDSFNDFVGFSISYLIVNLILFVYSYSLVQSDLNNQVDQPLFSSPWIFPIFQYNTKTGNIVKRNTPLLLFLTSCLILLIWCITVTIWVTPISVGICLTCLVEIFIFLIFIALSTWSTVQLGNVRTSLDPGIIKESWLKAKYEYLLSKGSVNNESCMNWRFFEDIESKKLQELNQLKGRSQSINLNNFMQIQTLYKEYYSAQEQSDKAMEDELRLMIHFSMLLILKVMDFRRRNMKEFLSFISGKRSDMALIGILFMEDTTKRTLQSQFSSYMRQFEQMSLDQQQKIMKLREQFKEELQKKQAVDDQRDKEEEEKKKKREEEIRKKMEKKVDTNNINWNQPLSQIPDCVDKYLKIIEIYEKEQKKYEDTTFACDNSTLTPDMQQQCQEWKRPDDNCSLFKDGYSPMDIHQGYIGDCYFLSAISIVGDQYLQKAFCLDNEKIKSKQNASKCGAYIVKFLIDYKDVYVIVDDRLPTEVGTGEWLLSRSEDQTELWPNILEKAYAKLYGGYDKIEGGKVSYVLAELTGGQPEEIVLKDKQDNVQTFWETLVEFKKLGYIMGCGSPAHAMGDRAVSDMGIVQGHAYSILNIQDVDGNHLLKIRNPHGNRGAEWQGDWSDNSPLWTQRLKNIINEQDFQEDGAFWMSIDDFVFEYRAIYLCRLFTSSMWTTIPLIEGQWVGQRAAGLPSKENPKAQMRNNPQYGIKVTKRCNLYVALTITETTDRMTGLYPIYYLCQKNDGKRVTGLSNDKLIGSNGMPSSMKTISGQMILDAGTFPYTFSLMIATMKQGGESPYQLQIYATDPNIKVISDSEFDV